MTTDPIRYPDTDAAARALEEELRAALAAPTQGWPRLLMLAGGSTPIEVYRRIGESPPDRVPPGTWLLLSDDRHVPIDDERSNYRAIHPMAAQLGIPDTRLIHPDPELPLQEAADEFGRWIALPARTGAEFELGILGIGGDGHTASLFSPDLVPAAEPGSSQAIGSGSPVYTTPGELAHAAGEKLGVERVSVSARVLLCFRRLIFFAPGENKQAIIRELQTAPERYPAGRVLMQHPNARIWTDQSTMR